MEDSLERKELTDSRELELKDLRNKALFRVPWSLIFASLCFFLFLLALFTYTLSQFLNRAYRADLPPACQLSGNQPHSFQSPPSSSMLFLLPLHLCCKLLSASGRQGLLFELGLLSELFISSPFAWPANYLLSCRLVLLPWGIPSLYFLSSKHSCMHKHILSPVFSCSFTVLLCYEVIKKKKKKKA